jgi:uncharacterized protein YbjT (DUF2867 family)
LATQGRRTAVPYTILRATQFFEFIGAIGQSNTGGNSVRLPHALIPPVAAEDVAAAFNQAAVAAPVNGIVS